MGFNFLDVLGNGSKSSKDESQKQNSQTQVTQSQDTESTTQSSEYGTQTGSNFQEVTYLDPEILKLITGRLTGTGEMPGVADTLLGIGNTLNTRAGDAEAAIAASLAASEGVAKQEFSRDVMGQINQAAQQFGSRDNSTYQLMARRGLEDLGVKLANIRAQGTLAGRELATKEYGTAASVLGGALESFLGTAKGAQATSVGITDTEQQKNTLQESVMSQILEALTLAQGKGSGSTDVAQGGTLGGFLQNVQSAMNIAGGVAAM